MHKFFILSLFLFLTIFLDSNFCLASDLPQNDTFLEKGLITKVLSEKHDKELERLFETEQIIQTLNVKVLTGDMKDKDIRIQNYLTSNPEFDIKVKEGDRVILEKSPDADTVTDEEKTQTSENDTEINITAKDNSPILLIVSGLFLLSLLIVGGYKGLKTLITLAFSAGIIAFGLIPAILTGFDVIPTAISVAIISALFGIFITNGFNLKSICASIGVTLSLILAGILSASAISIASIHSIDSQEGTMLLSQYPNLNFSGILTAAIIISTLGALISVGIAISNHIAKSKRHNNEYDFKKLFKKGSAAGKDAVSTMVTTLIFAYIGSALPLLLLSFNIPFLKFINLNVVVTELSAAIVSGIAIILCSPITAAISALIINKFAEKKAL